MKKFVSFSLSVVCSMVLVYGVVSAFSEPSGAPSSFNTPEPLNIGSEKQSKSGDLEVNNFTARGSITLGGVARTTWPGEGVAGCGWEGWKCDCQSDASTLAEIRLVVGLECRSNRLTDFKIMNLEITSGTGEKRCGATFGCDIIQ